MTRYSRGEVVLVSFPFSERQGGKRRPALIVSSDAYNAASSDVIIAQITSRVAAPPRPGAHRIEGWQQAGLLAPSLARARLATLHNSLILRRLGTMPDTDMRAFGQALALALGLGK
jgi:mRNA interferase MazF